MLENVASMITRLGEGRKVNKVISMKRSVNRNQIKQQNVKTRKILPTKKET